jgi:uncharacterized protein
VLFDGATLMSAILSGERQKVELLVRKGADVNHRTAVFGTFTAWPLYMAALYADEPVMRDLIRHGARLHDVDPDGASVLTQAALSGHTSVVRLLTKLGAEPNHYDKRGMTPLLWASTLEYASADTLQALLAAGPDPHAKGKSDVTALSQAQKYGNTEAAELLQKARAAR